MGEMQTAAAFLQGVNIIKLQSAARLAGLRWKSGAPGYDKAGIIARLSESPSIMRATIAALARMEGGEGPAKPVHNSLLDDLAEEQQSPAGERSEPPARTEHAPMPDALASGILRRLEALEGYAISRESAATIVQQELAPYQRKVETETAALRARLDALEASRPVQINIGPITLPAVSGQHERFPRMAKWLNVRSVEGDTVKARTHVLLIGPAGTGKTTAAVAFARMMNLEIYAQPLCMDYTGVTGFITATGEVIETEFSRAWKNGGVLLWDELSMSAPDAVGALNSALANGFLALPGVGNIPAHRDFYFIAGDNSDTGASMLFNARSLLDGASLDRFIRIDWPVDLKLEQSLANGNAAWLACVRAIRAFIQARDIQHVGATSRAVIQGSAALSTGAFSREEILEDTCKKGALAAEWSRVIELREVQQFLRGF
jgi:hypothetical protein